MMLRPIRTALSMALAVAFTAAVAAAYAAPPAERELLGVRIWRDYAAVLKRHGEPTRVVPGMASPPETIGGSINVGMQAGRAGMAGGMSMPGAPMMGGIPMPGAPMMGGMSMPGGPMLGGMMSAGGAMGPPGMRGGAMGMGGGRSMPGTSMGMGMPMGRGGIGGKDEDEDDIGRGGPIAGAGGAPMGAMGGPPMGAAGGGRGIMGGMGLSAPQYGGMSAPPGVGGMAGGITLPGGGLMGMTGPMMGGASGQVTARSEAPVSIPSEDVKETWVYVRGQHTFYFMFNRDGRVIRIQSFGTKGTGATSRSVTLGDPLSKVYKAYGWAGATIKQGDSLTLDYSQKAHVVFDLLDRRDGKGPRVVGITVAPTEGRN